MKERTTIKLKKGVAFSFPNPVKSKSGVIVSDMPVSNRGVWEKLTGQKAIKLNP